MKGKAGKEASAPGGVPEEVLQALETELAMYKMKNAAVTKEMLVLTEKFNILWELLWRMRNSYEEEGDGEEEEEEAEEDALEAAPVEDEEDTRALEHDGVGDDERVELIDKAIELCGGMKNKAKDVMLEYKSGTDSAELQLSGECAMLRQWLNEEKQKKRDAIALCKVKAKKLNALNIKWTTASLSLNLRPPTTALPVLRGPQKALDWKGAAAAAQKAPAKEASKIAVVEITDAPSPPARVAYKWPARSRSPRTALATVPQKQYPSPPSARHAERPPVASPPQPATRRVVQVASPLVPLPPVLDAPPPPASPPSPDRKRVVRLPPEAAVGADEGKLAVVPVPPSMAHYQGNAIQGMRLFMSAFCTDVGMVLHRFKKALDTRTGAALNALRAAPFFPNDRIAHQLLVHPDFDNPFAEEVELLVALYTSITDSLGLSLTASPRPPPATPAKAPKLPRRAGDDKAAKGKEKEKAKVQSAAKVAPAGEGAVITALDRQVLEGAMTEWDGTPASPPIGG